MHTHAHLVDYGVRGRRSHVSHDSILGGTSYNPTAEVVGNAIRPKSGTEGAWIQKTLTPVFTH